MAVPRRRILRPVPALHSNPARVGPKLRSRLDKERTVLARWMSRLRRAFHAVEKAQARIGRIEKQIARLED